MLESKQTITATAVKGKDLWRGVLLPILILAFSMTGVGLYAYAAAKNILKKNIANDMEAIAKLKVGQIEQWLNGRRDDAQLITTAQFSIDLQQWLESDMRNDHVKQRLLEQMRVPETVQQRHLSLRSALDGRLLLSTDDTLDSPKERQQAVEAATLGKMILDDIHIDKVDGHFKSDIGFFNPVFAKGNTRGTGDKPPLALIHMRMDPDEILFPLLQAWPGASPSAETLLLRKEDDQVVFLNTLRHLLASALPMKRPQATPHFIAARVIAEGAGFYEGNDYRGVPSLAYGLPVAGTPWFLVAKIDRDEAYRQLNTIAALTSTLLSVLLLVCTWWLLERKRKDLLLENAYRESEDLYQNAPCGYHSVDQNGMLVRINDTELRLLGFTRDEIVGRMHVQNLYTASSLAKFHEIFPHFLECGQINNIEFEFTRKDGTVIPVLFSATALKDNNGQFLMSRSIVYDLTELKRMEHSLRLSEERFRTLFGSIRDAVFVHDIRANGMPGNFIDVNDVACEQLGYSREELLSLRPMDIEAPDSMVDTGSIVEQLAAGRAIVFEQLHLTKDGRRIPVEISANTFTLHGKAMVTALVRNITERKEIEKELIDSREQLRKLAIFDDDLREEERKHIAREVHDELGQLLTVLKMNISLLQMQFDKIPGLVEKTEEMHILVENTIRVVRHIVSDLRPAALDMGIAGALEWLGDDFARHSGIRCSYEGPATDPSLEDKTATAVFRIAQESLTNVARHASANNVSIRLTSNDGWLKLSIEDDGCGFDPLVIAQRRSNFGLLGMRERVTALNGRHHIDSSPGKGTHIVIEIPLPARTLQ